MIPTPTEVLYNPENYYLLTYREFNGVFDIEDALWVYGAESHRLPHFTVVHRDNPEVSAAVLGGKVSPERVDVFIKHTSGEFGIQ